MRLLEHIWTDIRGGENIDLYATIVISFVVVFLSVFGIAPSGLIAPLTLAVLGLLAASNLMNRHHIEELIKSASQSAQGFFSEEFPADFKDNLQSAQEVWLIGVTLRGTIKDYYGLIDEKLRKDYKVKVLLVHPEGAGVEVAASRYYAPSSREVERIGTRIKDSLASLCGLQQVAPDKLEIRTINNPLTFGAVCINPDTASGILYLEHFPFRTVAGTMPRFVLRASDGRWYNFFRKEIQMLWDAGVEWKCSSSSSAA